MAKGTESVGEGDPTCPEMQEKRQPTGQWGGGKLPQEQSFQGSTSSLPCGAGKEDAVENALQPRSPQREQNPHTLCITRWARGLSSALGFKATLFFLTLLYGRGRLRYRG